MRSEESDLTDEAKEAKSEQEVELETETAALSQVEAELVKAGVSAQSAPAGKGWLKTPLHEEQRRRMRGRESEGWKWKPWP